MAKCFVIMPFGEKKDAHGEVVYQFDTDVYEGLISRALQGFKDLNVVRADKVLRAGWIQKDMIRHIADADICIVDLTTFNPNVLYELGVRHALRRHSTILIRRREAGGAGLPFNLRGMRVIDYDTHWQKFEEAQRQITEFVGCALGEPEGDSLVFEAIPELKVSIGAEKRETPLQGIDYVRYPLKAHPERCVGVVAGDIHLVRGIPIWVNSENTNMQMARFFDRSISSIIRYLGARKDGGGHVTEDLIADDLVRQLGGIKTVMACHPVKTTSGALAAAPRHVKFIVHVAAVEGALGAGYKPVANLDRCIGNVLHLIEENTDEFKSARASALFPLLGTGTAAARIEDLAPQLLGAAVDHLKHAGQSVFGTVWFLAYTDRQFAACIKALNARNELGTPIAGNDEPAPAHG